MLIDRDLSKLRLCNFCKKYDFRQGLCQKRMSCFKKKKPYQQAEQPCSLRALGGGQGQKDRRGKEWGEAGLLTAASKGSSPIVGPQTTYRASTMVSPQHIVDLNLPQDNRPLSPGEEGKGKRTLRQA